MYASPRQAVERNLAKHCRMKRVGALKISYLLILPSEEGELIERRQPREKVLRKGRDGTQVLPPLQARRVKS